MMDMVGGLVPASSLRKCGLHRLIWQVAELLSVQAEESRTTKVESDHAGRWAPRPTP